MGDIFGDFRRLVIAALDDLSAAGTLPSGLDYARVAVEPPRDPSHGDLATNAAMVLAGSLPSHSDLAHNPTLAAAGQIPSRTMVLAETICGALTGRELESAGYRGAGFAAAVAPPGFINIRLDAAVWHAQLREILNAGTTYGDSAIGAGRRVNVEFVSANPTGPMHVGHGRGAVVGDALAALLKKAGFAVEREYYINDAGAQVDALARSVYFRYCEAVAAQPESALLHSSAVSQSALVEPEGFYPGEYLKETGRQLFERDGERWIGKAETVWLGPLREFAVAEMMALIRDDLTALGIRFDQFSSEKALVAAGAVDKTLGVLEDRGLVYTGVLEPPKGKLPDDWEPRPQLLFRATQFGDEVDRPLKKSDGSWTYFAADIAYHFDKYRRGGETMIDVWGADHGGYVKRVNAAVQALTNGAATLDVKLCQLVSLFDNGQPVRMSKRAGTFVTLREVVDEVGKDVFRFIMLTRRNDQALEFDFAKVTEQSKDNPVFYVQYAHARACSVMRHAAEEFSGKLSDKLSGELSDTALAGADLALLTDPAELSLIRLLASWPRLVASAAEAHEPHRVAFYLQEVAAQFHLLWTKGRDEAQLRFIISGEPDLTRARLALVRGVAIVVASGLAVFGVTPAEEM